MLILEILGEGARAAQFDARGEPCVVVGRGADCNLVVDRLGVSRRHCMFQATPHGWQLEDLGSSGGTVLNGARLRSAVVVSPGDVVAIGGETRIRVAQASPPGR